MSQLLPAKAEGDGEPPQGLITNSSDNAITFEVEVPVEDILVETIEVENQAYTQIQLPGFTNMIQEGAPELPFLTEVLGAPFDSEITVTVTPGKLTKRKLSAPLLPVASESVAWDLASLAEGSFGEPIVTTSTNPDPEIYQSAAIFPAELGKVANDAVLRSQRLVSIALYPIQYDPASNELLVYDRLLVTVEFTGAKNENQGAGITEPMVFENFFQDNLLNYEQAKTWREDVVSESSSGLTASPTHWSPPDPGWRVKVRETGFYKLTFAELTAAGIPVGSININTLKMFHLGEEIAIKVLPGEAIVFYGEAIDSKYTADNVYWLTYGGSAGLRMQPVDGTLTGAAVPASFLTRQHLEEDHLYRSKATGGDDMERFFWGGVVRNAAAITPWSYTFSLADYLVGDLAMNITLIGYYEDISVNPDHHAAISVNGTQVADITWDGYNTLEFEFEISAALLLPGDNTLQVTTLPTGINVDVFYVDSIDMEYDRTFSSEMGRLDFSYNTPGEWQFVLTDFTAEEIDVYDVSATSTPKWIDNVQVNSAGAAFSAVFHDQIASLKDYAALDQDAYHSVQAIEADTPSDLASELNGADYLMISHHDFLSAAAALQAQKTSQGLRTELIDVQDIYDEFGYGIVDIHAIRNFIAYAHWAEPAPAYVLLIGDGHFDPKDNLGYGRTSFIPPFLAFTDATLGETAADNRYVSIIGDDVLADLNLGRLSVNTAAEAEAFIEKILAYETNPPEGDWKRQILAIADKPDYFPKPAHYPLISERLLRDLFPSAPFSAEEVYWQWTYTDFTEARAAIQNAFNNGIFLVNYIGHGAYTFWGWDLHEENFLFGTDDIPSLQPQNKLPVILAMTCMEGYYLSPNPYSSDQEALAEVITRTQGKGAVASWSPTGWGSVSGHDVLDRGFFRAVYQGETSLVGEATHTGLLDLWATGNNLDLLDTFLLFGDPAMRLSLSLTALMDNYSANEDEVLSVSADLGVLANDINPDNAALTAIQVSSTAHGLLQLNGDGSFVYTPEADYYGADSFSYKVSNGSEISNTVFAQIYVNAVKDPPVAEDQTVVTTIDTPVEIELTAIIDEGGSSRLAAMVIANTELIFEVLTQPTHGTLSGEAPYLVYTPNPSYLGLDQFTFRAKEGVLVGSIGTVEILVSNPPVYLPLVSRP